MDTEFTGRYGRENSQKQGKTFYKGREKQISRDKNPSQWSAYNRAPRVKRTVNHHNPLSHQLWSTRRTGNLSKKSLPSIVDESNENDEKDINEVLIEIPYSCYNSANETH